MALPLDETRFLLVMSQLTTLTPFLFACVLQEGPYLQRDPLPETDGGDLRHLPPSSCPLTSLEVILGSKERLSWLLGLYQDHLAQEWFAPWEQLNWVVNNLIPRMLEVCLGVGLSFSRVVRSLCLYTAHLCRTFGPTFTDKKVKPKFEELVVLPEEQLDMHVGSGQTALTTCVVPVYAAGVLTAFNTEAERECLEQFLTKLLCTLALSGAPLTSLQAAVKELRSSASHHETLLSVLWACVAHSSPQVRAAVAAMFELMVKGVSDSLVSSRVVPALVTLANDPEMSVRIATIPSLGTVIENITNREVLDRVYMQLQMFFDDVAYRDVHSVHVELIRTLARVGPNTEPKFRDEFVLPRLAAMAMANNGVSNDTKKRDVALQLFDAYSAMSCCCLSDQLISEAMLPGLRCLRQDAEVIAPEHEEVISAMIRDYQTRLDTARSSADRSASFTGAHPGTSPAGEDMKTRVMSRIKDTTSKANISNIFNRKK